MGVKCRVLSWDEVYSLAKSTADEVKKSKFRPDAVIGIARGGWFLARVLCDFLGVKDLYSIKVGHWGVTAEKDQEGAKLHQGLNISLEGKDVLLVDDITDTGQSLEVAKQHVLESGKPDSLKTATLLHIATSAYKPDYYGKEIEWAWMIFPWNYWEDVENLITKMLENKQMTPGEIAEYFLREHGIDVPVSNVNKALIDLVEKDVVKPDGEDRYSLTKLLR